MNVNKSKICWWVLFFFKVPRHSVVKSSNTIVKLATQSCFLSSSCSMETVSETVALFHCADAVCFDVDSTVICEEGIDELAKFCGVGDAVTEMSGTPQSIINLFLTSLSHYLSEYLFPYQYLSVSFSACMSVSIPICLHLSWSPPLVKCNVVVCLCAVLID